MRVRARVPAAVAERLRRFDLNGAPAATASLTRIDRRVQTPAPGGAGRPRRHTSTTPATTCSRPSRAGSRPGERASVGTGIAVAIPEGHAGLVLPRSGLAARHGIALVNAPGLIDAGYRGELRVLLLNTDRASAFEIEPGDRIAQLVIARGRAPEFVEASELPETVRGTAGFGSTGVS